MTDEGFSLDDQKTVISRGGYLFVPLWTLSILLLYVLSGYFGARRRQPA